MEFTFFRTMTKEEFKDSILEDIKEYPSNWRKGQKIFNYIDANYHVARKVQFRDKIDCFYNDNNIDKFIDKAYNIINNE